MVKLDILSDPICPWCYIGKSNLDRALIDFPDHPFTMEWHPFQLNPDMPAAGMDRREYLEAKFGGKENTVAVYAKIEEAAKSAGLEINLAAITKTPNTLNAHRLIHWAGIEQCQTFVVASLFKAYFCDGRDIGDVEILADIAGACGMDAAMTLHLLQGDAERDDISKRDTHSREMGVTGVPTFIIANKHVVPGAQPPELWTQVIGEIADQIDPAGS